MKQIDTETKVRLLFALSAPIDNNFLEELKTQAEVIVDDHKRIIKYKKNGEDLEFSGTHKVPNSEHWKTNPEYIELLNFLINITKNAKSPLCLRQIAMKFKKTSRSPKTVDSLSQRIGILRQKVHKMKQIEMDTKVKLLFALSAPINNDFFNELKAQADVVLDDHQRIIKYRKKGGGLELDGIHVIIYEISDTIRRDKRMMEFLAQKSKTLDSRIIGRAFLKEFKETTGATEHIRYLQQRYKLLKIKIHESEDFDEKTKVRMMFVSGATVPDYFIGILRKDALVEVDKKNRIIKYKANDGSFELQGDHSTYAKVKSVLAERKKHEALKSTDSDSDIESDCDSDNNSSEEFEAETDSDIDDYPDETGENIDANDFDYEVPVRRRTYSEMEVEDGINYNLSTEGFHRSEESEMKKTRKSRVDNKNMNPEAAYEAENTEEQVTTRSGRVSKKRVLDLDFVMDGSKDNEGLPSTKSKKSSSAASTSVNPKSAEKKRKTDREESSSLKRSKQALDDYIGHAELNDNDPNDSFHRTDKNAMEAPAGIKENEDDKEESGELEQNIKKSSAPTTSFKKKRKSDTEGSKTSTRAHPDSFIRTGELHDYNSNQSTDNSSRVELKPFRGSLLDNEHLNPMDDDIQVLERPPAPAPKDSEMIEAPIKTEEPVTPQQEAMPRKVENPVVEEVKPKLPKFTSQLKLLEAIKLLVVNLDFSSLSQIKSKICRKIWKNGELDKKIPNEVMILAMELLVARITNDSVIYLDETVESVGLLQFLCFLQCTILNLKLEGLDALLGKIKERIKEPLSKDKRIPIETMENVLQTTLDVIGF